MQKQLSRVWAEMAFLCPSRVVVFKLPLSNMENVCLPGAKTQTGDNTHRTPMAGWTPRWEKRSKFSPSPKGRPLREMPIKPHLCPLNTQRLSCSDGDHCIHPGAAFKAQLKWHLLKPLPIPPVRPDLSLCSAFIMLSLSCNKQ